MSRINLGTLGVNPRMAHIVIFFNNCLGMGDLRDAPKSKFNFSFKLSHKASKFV